MHLFDTLQHYCIQYDDVFGFWAQIVNNETFSPYYVYEFHQIALVQKLSHFRIHSVILSNESTTNMHNLYFQLKINTYTRSI